MKQLVRWLLSTKIFIALFTIALAGCVSSSSMPLGANSIAVALPNPYWHGEQEVMVTRLNQLLRIQNISQTERASLYFERGVLYDSLGLWTLAREDFIQALAIRPNMAAAYNYLGLYLLLDQDYQDAFKAFERLLAIDPNYEYAFFNRGLASYYSQDYQQAEQDFSRFHQAEPTDPYGIIWLYLNELAFMPTQAQQNLALRSQHLSQEQWGTYLVRYYLGQLSTADLVEQMANFAQPDTPKHAEILTETYFYLAKQKLNMGQTKEAGRLFRLALANQVYNFVEYRFALLELAKFKAEQSAIQAE